MCHHPGTTWAPPTLTTATLWGCQTTLPQCCPSLAHSHIPGGWCHLSSAQAGRGWLPQHSGHRFPLLNTHPKVEYWGWHTTWVQIPLSCGYATTKPSTCYQCQHACCSSQSCLCTCRAVAQSGNFGIPTPQPHPLLSTSAAQHSLATSGMGRGTQAKVWLGSCKDPNPAWPASRTVQTRGTSNE